MGAEKSAGSGARGTLVQGMKSCDGCHTRGRPWEHREEDRTLGREEAKEQKGQTLKDYLYGNNKEHPGDCERTETRRGRGW